MSSTGDVIITAAALRDQLGSDRPVVLLEVRREPADDAAGRIPGARPVALSTDLVAPPSEGSGAFPLPDPARFQDAVRRWGIDAGTLVVVYSPEAPALAARAWWTLRWAGVPEVRYLDGGLLAWTALGGELSDELPEVTPGSFTVVPGSLPVLDADQAAGLARSGVLLDARDLAGYAGDPAGGHIPGAVHLPGADNIDANGLLRGADELIAAYTRVGLGRTEGWGAYCGGGTGATLDVLALATIGVTAALYPGSFSEWITDPARPVVAGTQPG